MSALLLSELRRALARRIVRFFFVVSVVGILIAALVTFARSHDESGLGPSSTDRRQQFEACIQQAPEEPGRFEECVSRLGDPFLERDRTFYLAELPDYLTGTTVPIAILAWLIGASLIGAEWRAGTVTTILTWEPNRIRLMLAKAAVAVAVCMAFAFVLQSLILLTLTPSGLWRGTTEGFSFATTAGVVLRSTFFAGIAGAIGFSIGGTGRNTAAALGIGFLYLAVVEGGLLGAIFPGIRPWLIVGNSIVFVGGEADLAIEGRSVPEAGLLLGIYAGAAIAATTAIFRARDVT